MRAGGVLMPITSLSSPHGIGSMGKEAYEFVDFLRDAGQTYWQLLPICPTSYGDSPYQSFSTFAGNPYLIDPEKLIEDGYLFRNELDSIDWETTPDRVNYEVMYKKRFPMLKKAVTRFLEKPEKEYEKFIEDNGFWIEDYALFMALKDAHGGKSWQMWEDSVRLREKDTLEQMCQEYRQQIDFWKAVQYLFKKQWDKLKAYANENGIFLIGDLPIYVALDSSDVWSRPSQFQLDKDLIPTEVAGCPPDGFSADGQLWGNPLFDWDAMKKDGYSWWIKRIEHIFSLFDVLRIDHFRGFAGYYAIPYKDKNARNGRWRKGPGMDLFKHIEKKLGRRKIIAEDLGFLTPDVRELLKECGYPGMKVLEFAFDSRDGDGNDYRPYRYPEKCIAYVGTHDNDTACGWMKTAPYKDRRIAKEYLGLSGREGYNWGMMRAIWASRADTAIVTSQDLLGLGSEARMNIPSTVGNNWVWRAMPGVFDKQLAKKIRGKMEIYARLPQ